MSDTKTRGDCKGSGRVAIIALLDPRQTTAPSIGRDLLSGKIVKYRIPTNGKCVRCGGWFPITERGLLERHVRR